MVKGFKKDGKFVPTGNKHTGLGKQQISGHHEIPSSIGNEMLMRKKEALGSEECTRCQGSGENRYGTGFCYRCLGTGNKKRDKRTLEDGTNLTKMQESTLGKLENGEVLTESDVNHIKNSLNGSFRNGEINESFTDELDDIFSEGKEFPLTDEQTTKGITWLQKSRIQNKYLGEREREIVQNFDHFALVDFAEIGNNFSVPVYKVVATNGDSFDYHITGTGSASAIDIVG